MSQAYGVVRDHLIGYEVVDQKPESAIIKAISTINPDEFDAIKKRNKELFLDMVQGIHQGIIDKDIEKIISCRNLEQTNNKFSSYLKTVIDQDPVSVDNMFA